MLYECAAVTGMEDSIYAIRLNTMGIMMATIALLFTAVLISQGTGLIFGAIFESRQTAETCFDIFIGTETPAQDSKKASALRLLKKR